jgi:DNA-binding transcriptional MerR regulator
MKYEITLRAKTTIRPGELYDHIAAAELAGVSVRRLLHYWRYAIIQPVRNTGRYGIFFDDGAIYTLRKAECLRREMRLNYSGIRAVLLLEDRIAGLDAEVRFLRK